MRIYLLTIPTRATTVLILSKCHNSKTYLFNFETYHYTITLTCTWLSPTPHKPLPNEPARPPCSEVSASTSWFLPGIASALLLVPLQHILFVLATCHIICRSACSLYRRLLLCFPSRAIACWSATASPPVTQLVAGHWPRNVATSSQRHCKTVSNQLPAASCNCQTGDDDNGHQVEIVLSVRQIKELMN